MLFGGKEKKQLLINMGCNELITKPIDKIPTTKTINNELMYSTLRRNVIDYEQKNETDPMTGLLNKEVFQINVRRLLKRGNFGAMITFDIDNTQFINEFFSHQEGDRIIQGFAKCLQKCMPKNSPISHISGDRFCAFIPNVTAHNDIENICKNFLKYIEENLKIVDSSRQITASIGIAICPMAATTYDNLITKANHALLFVKNHGKSGIRFHTPRDDRDELLKGKQEITFEHASTILRPRKTEEIQTWLKFGEFRVVYTAFLRYGDSNPAASLTLINIVSSNRSEKPDFNKVVSLNQKITTFIREAQYPGVYSWYSINQLLVLDVRNQNINKAITQLKVEISEEMKFLELDLDIFNKTRSDNKQTDF